ncbi:MAG: SPOR domain-containing protein [Bacteroidales bacterium]
MKRNLILVAVALATMTIVSCKSNQKAYKAAYEKAKEKEVETPLPVAQPEQAYEVVEVKRTPITPAPVQQEKVTGVTESDRLGLKRYNVVIGSFMNNTNATALKEQMEKDGYRVILAQNEKQMYRVICASFNDRESATIERDAIKKRYSPRFNDIWLLDNQ